MDTSIFTKNGRYLMLALDHRESFKKLINSENPAAVEKEQIVERKKEIVSTVYDQMSGLLIDVEYGLEACRKLSLKTPFLLPAEETGYKDKNGERITKIKYDAKTLKSMGAAGVKLLICFNPEAKSAPAQIQTAKKVLRNAHENRLPLFLEIVHYNGEPDVPQTVKKFLENEVKADVFKLEFPGDLESCRKVTKVLEDTPWILLSKGDNFEEFCRQLETATKAGCQGFLAGRSLWQESLRMKDREGRKKFLEEILPARFKIVSGMMGIAPPNQRILKVK